MSHELKTPLAVLSAAVENLATADDATRASLADEIRTATRRLNRLVNNLFDQTRLESGALKPRLDWCDGHDLVNAAVDGVGELLGGHPFETDIPKDLPLFRADSALMEQVIANLLLNAALHTPQGTPIFLAAGVDREVPDILHGGGPGTGPARGHAGAPVPEVPERRCREGRGPRPRSLDHPGLCDSPGRRGGGWGEPGGGAVLTVYLPFTAHGLVPAE